MVDSDEAVYRWDKPSGRGAHQRCGRIRLPKRHSLDKKGFSDRIPTPEFKSVDLAMWKLYRPILQL